MKMYESFVLTTAFKVFKKVLPQIAKKIYSQDKFMKDVEIDVRSTFPISFTLNSGIPEVNIYLKLINKSPYLNCFFDRAKFSLWLSSTHGTQPIIKEGWFLSKEKLQKGESKEIFFQSSLNNFQVNFLKEIQNDKKLSANLNLEIYIQSELYNFKKSISLENKQCVI